MEKGGKELFVFPGSVDVEILARDGRTYNDRTSVEHDQAQVTRVDMERKHTY